MKIYAVRHGQTAWNVEKIAQGWADNPLNEIGFRQAECVANEIAKLKIEYFYSSDSLRAKQTAEIINKSLNKEIIYDRRLREKSAGEAQGHKISEYKDNHDFWNNPHKYYAETFEDVYIRIKNLLDEIKTKNLNNILMITHGWAISMLHLCVLYKEWDNNNEAFTIAKFKNFQNCSINEFDY